jgi:tungstate transport system ATP-binding protein
MRWSTCSRRARQGVRVLEAANLSFDRGGRRLVDDVTLRLAPAPALTAVMGPNGSGKTLLVMMLAALATPTSGQVLWDGAAPDDTAHRLRAFVFQRPVMLRRSVEANVRHALSTLELDRAEVRARTAAALDQAGLAALAARPAPVLSGGEQARLALARALARQPKLLFLDEPTANLDPAATAAVEAIAVEARGRGTKILLVTHDTGQARRLADEVVFMSEGRVVEHAPAATFFARAQSPEARAFLEGRILIRPGETTC